MHLAERRLQLEILEKSKLWSPRFTPAHFRLFFMIPVTFGIGLVIYLHYVQIPRRMLYWKQQQKFNFPDLERMGMLKDWIEDEYADEFYPDEI